MGIAQERETPRDQPDAIKKAALAAVASSDIEIDKMFRSNPKLAAELLGGDIAQLPVGLPERLRLLFAGQKTLGGAEEAATLTPTAMLGILQVHPRPDEYWWDVSASTKSRIFVKDESLYSPDFTCGDVSFFIQVKPAGSNEATEGRMSMFLSACSDCSFKALLCAGSRVRSLSHDLKIPAGKPSSGVGYHDEPLFSLAFVGEIFDGYTSMCLGGVLPLG